MSAKSFAEITSFPPVFDPARAERTLADLKNVAPAVLKRAPFRQLLESTAGNSPFLAQLMLKEHAFLVALLLQGPDGAIADIEREVAEVANGVETKAVMRSLRAARRKFALAVGLADIAGLYDLNQVTAALTRFA